MNQDHPRASVLRVSLYPGLLCITSCSLVLDSFRRAEFGTGGLAPVFALASIFFLSETVKALTTEFDDEGVSQVSFIGKRRVSWHEVKSVQQTLRYRDLCFRSAEHEIRVIPWTMGSKPKLVAYVRQQLRIARNTESDQIDELRFW